MKDTYHYRNLTFRFLDYLQIQLVFYIQCVSNIGLNRMRMGNFFIDDFSKNVFLIKVTALPKTGYTKLKKFLFNRKYCF